MFCIIFVHGLGLAKQYINKSQFLPQIKREINNFLKIKENSVISKATHVSQACVTAWLSRSFPRTLLYNFLM